MTSTHRFGRFAGVGLATLSLACSSAQEPSASVESDVERAAAGNESPSKLGDGAPASPDDGVVWPNEASRANSDPWIAENHARITRMKPRVLAINFARKAGYADQFETVAEGLRQMSRYHGYADDAAAPFLDPQLRMIDMSDGVLPSQRGLNGARVPLKCQEGAQYQFDYKALFGDAFAEATGGDLCERVRRGDVHEVWLRLDGDRDPYTCPNGVRVADQNVPELHETKQVYDAEDRPVPGRFERCAGNGCFAPDDDAVIRACGRSLKILFVNASRGPGCALHSIGHGIEGNGGIRNTKAVPALARDFIPFARFDLADRGAPFRHFYDGGRDLKITYPEPEAAAWSSATGSGTIEDYGRGCGNVHFAPNSATSYDYTSSKKVLAACEAYGLGGGGAAERDARGEYSAAKVAELERRFPDCGGGWLVYWGQSMPGLGNRAHRADGSPMKNWWPYRYY